MPTHNRPCPMHPARRMVVTVLASITLYLSGGTVPDVAAAWRATTLSPSTGKYSKGIGFGNVHGVSSPRGRGLALEQADFKNASFVASWSYYLRPTAGARWSKPRPLGIQPIEGSDPGTDSPVQALSDGRFVVMGYAKDEGGRLHASVFGRRARTPRRPQPITSQRTSAGNADLVVGGDRALVIANTRASGSARTRVEFALLEKGNTRFERRIAEPSTVRGSTVSASRAGDFVVAWQTRERTIRVASRRVNAARWTISTLPGTPGIGDVSFAALPDGRFIAVWSETLFQSREGSNEIITTLFSSVLDQSGISWSAPQTVSRGVGVQGGRSPEVENRPRFFTTSVDGTILLTTCEGNLTDEAMRVRQITPLGLTQALVLPGACSSPLGRRIASAGNNVTVTSGRREQFSVTTLGLSPLRVLQTQPLTPSQNAYSASVTSRLVELAGRRSAIAWITSRTVRTSPQDADLVWVAVSGPNGLGPWRKKLVCQAGRRIVIKGGDVLGYDSCGRLSISPAGAGATVFYSRLRNGSRFSRAVAASGP